MPEAAFVVRLVMSLLCLGLLLSTAFLNRAKLHGNVEEHAFFYRVHWRFPTWLKEISLLFMFLFSLGDLINQWQSRVDVLLTLAGLQLLSLCVLLACDSIGSLREPVVKQRWIPSYAFFFADKVIAFLFDQSTASMIALVFAAIATGIAFFQAFAENTYIQKKLPTAEFRCSLKDYIYFAYINIPLIQLSMKKGELQYEDIPGLSDADSADVISEQLDKINAAHPTFSLTRSLFELVKREWYLEGVFQWIASTMSFLAPLALEKILIFVRYHGDTAKYDREGLLKVNIWFAVFLLFFGPFCKSIADGQNYVRGRHIGLRVKAALICKIYKKSLTVDLSASKESIGKLNNLMSVDVSDIQTFCAYSHYTWSTPYEIVISITLLFLVLGKAALAGLVVMILTLWFGFFMGTRLTKLQDKVLKNKDRRIGVMNEVLNSIRILKFYGWEIEFMEKIKETRVFELASLFIYSLTSSGLDVIWKVVPAFVGVTAFLTYTYLLGNELNPSIGFTAMTLFNLLRFPLSAFPDMINMMARTKTSLSRIESFLKTEDVDGLPADESDTNTNPIAKGKRELELGEVLLTDVKAAWRRVLEDHHDQDDSGKPPAFDPDRKLFCCSSWASPPSLNSISMLAPKGNRSKSKDGMKYNLLSNPGDVEMQQQMNDDSDAPTAPTSPVDNNLVPVLHKVDVDVKPGSLVVVIGSTGAGKSSFLQGILLGESKIIGGERRMKGDLAYSPQSSWIQNATLRDNILFGSAFDQKRYDAVIKACSLDLDIKILADGDQTEIGEKGVNLSGGQQQRVNLARAAYSRSGIILMDDPLSAVDAHVGDHIFRNLVLGFLSDRTRILVTHNLGLVLPYADYVLCVDAEEKSLLINGEKRVALQQAQAVLARCGTDAPDDANTFLKSIVSALEETPVTAMQETKPVAASSQSSAVLTVPALQPAATNKLVSIEQKQSGDVSWETYWFYINASGGFFVAAALVLGTLWVAFSWFTQNYCLGLWMDEMEHGENSAAALDDYLFSVVSVLFALMFLTVIQMVSSLSAAQKIHDRLVSSVLLAPCSWYDATPIGRIINRFSQDISTIDSTLMLHLLAFVDCLIGTTQVVAVISWFLPWLLIPFIPVMGCAAWVAYQYLQVSRELKRLENIKKSPVFVLFSETLNGLPVIRAFRKQDQFFQTCCHHVDAMNKCHIYLWISNRWLHVRVGMLGTVVIGLVGIAIVFSITSGSSMVGTPEAGLALMYSLSFCENLLFLARTHADCQMDLNSAERIQEYSAVASEKYMTEVSSEISFRDILVVSLSLLQRKKISKQQMKQMAKTLVSSNDSDRRLDRWPSKGNVVFDRLVLQYQSSPKPVLREVSFNVPGGAKVGVVGRTGAGKSSLITALFRIVEPLSGEMYIDGENILRIPLHTLRTKIAIVPQEPTLFRGSLRFNLDPFDLYEDEEIWKALESCQLADFVRSYKPNREESTTAPTQLDLDSDLVDSRKEDSQLDSLQVAEKGSNFSVGQRQLVCLARAILRRAKVLVLDECTASVDHETDYLIQEIVRSQLKDVTVICIAHRLHTVAFYDAVLVMDQGRVVEYGHPSDLISNNTSVFHQMCQRSGNFDELEEIAKTSRYCC